MQEKTIRVGIVGGTGYTGVELLRLLARHPNVKVCAITSRKEAGTPVTSMYPSLRGFMGDLIFSTAEEAKLTECDVVFFATPHGVAMSMARELTEAGVKIIDLAADACVTPPCSSSGTSSITPARICWPRASTVSPRRCARR